MAKASGKSARRVRKAPEVTAVLVPVERVERSILLIRAEKVILDADLAELYGVPTGRLNEQVRRNGGRFPSDFMFQLTDEEFSALRSQIAISKVGRGVDHAELARQLKEMEKTYDAQFKQVFAAIRSLMTAPVPRDGSRIGF